jgi:hypothetical protein
MLSAVGNPPRGVLAVLRAHAARAAGEDGHPRDALTRELLQILGYRQDCGDAAVLAEPIRPIFSPPCCGSSATPGPESSPAGSAASAASKARARSSEPAAPRAATAWETTW